MKNSKQYIVGDIDRQNPMSFQPGGSVVTVYYKGYHTVYDKVKHPNAYISKILRTAPDVMMIEVNGDVVYPWTPDKK